MSDMKPAENLAQLVPGQPNTEAPEAKTIPDLLNAAATRWPTSTYLDFSGETYTFADVDLATTRVAHGLSALGVSRGDRVCFMLDNHADFVFLWFALAKLGAVSVPINTAFRGEFLRHQLADAEADVVVVESDYADRVFAIEDSIPATKKLLVRGDLDAVETRLEVHPFSKIHSLDTTPIETQIGADDLAMLLYTSGTTGPSKGCMISHGYMSNSGLQVSTMTESTENEIYWTPCPLFHMGCSNMVVGCLHFGATASIYPHFSLSKFWPEIERSGATGAMILSSMLSLVADAPDTEESKRCYGQLRIVMGTPFSPALREVYRQRFGVKIAGGSGYGMTEAVPITTYPLSKQAPDGASGARLGNFDVEIVDENDNICPPGVVGEVVFRPRIPHVMFDGYWRKPQATVDATRNLWFHAGDLGRFDEDGFFYWVDRKKDYMRRGGENISSFELEVQFRGHPEIADVAVHAVPSEHTEDEVKVTAILIEGATVTEEALCHWSIERLPHFAVPRYIEFRDEMPRNGVGRVLKYELREQGVTPGTWDRVAAGIVVRKR